MIDRLINLAIETEGLLRVLKDNPSAEAKELLEEKFEQFSQIFYTEIPRLTETQQKAPDTPDTADTADTRDTLPPAVKLDEMLCRREARDLTRAFTLNDKFRFTREFFAGDKTRFADTLNMLMAMHTLDEARDYITADLAIDPDNETGADFMAIITNHFNGR